jgi:hypothetical protein
MSGKGNCFDNAMAETFFETLKAELVWRVPFQSRAEATNAIGRAIDGFYNSVRRHSALDFISPTSIREAGCIKQKRSPLRRSKSKPARSLHRLRRVALLDLIMPRLYADCEETRVTAGCHDLEMPKGVADFNDPIREVS